MSTFVVKGVLPAVISTMLTENIGVKFLLFSMVDERLRIHQSIHSFLFNLLSSSWSLHLVFIKPDKYHSLSGKSSASAFLLKSVTYQLPLSFFNLFVIFCHDFLQLFPFTNFFLLFNRKNTLVELSVTQGQTFKLFIFTL